MATLRLLPAPSMSSFHNGEISACRYSADNQFVLTGGWDGHLRLWDAQVGVPVTSLRVGSKPVSACAISPDGSQWLAGGLDGILSRWDPTTQNQVSSFLAHTRPISAIQFGSDGKALITASWDCKMILWDLRRERDGRTLGGHQDIVAGCCWTPNERTILSWSHDRTVRLWEVARARLAKTFNGHADRVVAAAVSPDGSWAVSGSRDGVLKVWDLQAEFEAGSLKLESGICSCFFLLFGESFGTIEANGRLRLYSLPDLEVASELSTRLAVQCAALSPSGGQIALGCSDGRVHFVSVDGYDSVPLVVTATQTCRQKSTFFQRLFNRNRPIPIHLCTCPACRQQVELPSHEPDQAVPCPRCQRLLRVRAVVPQGALPA